MAERFIIFSSKAAFDAGSDKYDGNSIVFVKDPNEPGIYTHNFGWITLPSNAVADQILSFVEGKAKWIDKDYYTKGEVDSKIADIDVTDQLTEYAKTSDVETKIEEAIDSAKSEIDTKITSIKSEILGGAGEDYDTLKEIEQWISEHQDLYEALIAANATKEYVDGKVEDLVSEADVDAKLGDYYTKEEVDALFEWGEY